MSFDYSKTVISQYANSPIILSLISSLSDAIDQTTDFDNFFNMVWNVETAQGWGLDVLGRIVGVRRVLRLPTTETLFRFEETTDPDNFGNAPFETADTSTQNYALSDDAFRRVILAKAALNITDCGIPAINRIIMTLFPGYGNCYVRDDGGMALTYVFSADLSEVDFAIATQSGVLPRPVGVSTALEQP